MEERKANGKFSSVEDFVLRVESRDLNKKSVESLIKAGALDSLGERNELLANVERILVFAKERQKAKSNGQFSLFESSDSVDDSINKLQLVAAEPIDKTEKMAWEKELLGLYVSDHPLKEYSVFLRNTSKIISEITNNDVSQIITVGGIITKIQKIITRAGKSMIFANLEDLTGKIEILVFPKLLESNSEIWEEGNIVFVKGKVSDKDGVFKLLAESVRRIDLDEAKNYKPPLTSSSQEESGDEIKKSINITVSNTDTKNILMKLSDLLNSVSAGDCEVYISIPSAEGKYKKIKTSRDIECEKGILGEIRKVVGEESVEVK